jgi:hypothetical protein
MGTEAAMGIGARPEEVRKASASAFHCVIVGVCFFVEGVVGVWCDLRVGCDFGLDRPARVQLISVTAGWNRTKPHQTKWWWFTFAKKKWWWFTSKKKVGAQNLEERSPFFFAR